MKLHIVLVANTWMLWLYSQGNGQVNVARGLELLASISRQVSSETSEEVHVNQTGLSSVRRAPNSLRNGRCRGG